MVVVSFIRIVVVVVVALTWADAPKFWIASWACSTWDWFSVIDNESKDWERLFSDEL